MLIKIKLKIMVPINNITKCPLSKGYVSIKSITLVGKFIKNIQHFAYIMLYSIKSNLINNIMDN